MPYLKYALVDPDLISTEKELNDVISFVGVGECDIFTYEYFQPLGFNYINIERTKINDPVNALKRGVSSCSANHTLHKYYSSYSTTVSQLPLRNVSICDVGQNETDVCPSTVFLRYSTNMVTYRTSARGTTWKKIITDESSIAGGVLYFTWFLGLYII